MDIEKMLRKRKFKGAEVGKVMLYSLACDVRNMGNEDYTPLVRQKDIDRMHRGIASREEVAVYNGYVRLYRALTNLYNYLLLVREQFEGGCIFLLWQLRETMLAEGFEKPFPHEIFGIGRLAQDEDMQMKISVMRNNTLMAARQRIRATNALFDCLAWQLDIPELTSLQTDTTPLTGMLRNLNEQRESLLSVLKTPEDKDAARKIFPVVQEDFPLFPLSLETQGRIGDFSLFENTTVNIILEIGG